MLHQDHGVRRVDLPGLGEGGERLLAPAEGGQGHAPGGQHVHVRLGRGRVRLEEVHRLLRSARFCQVDGRGRRRLGVEGAQLEGLPGRGHRGVQTPARALEVGEMEVGEGHVRPAADVLAAKGDRLLDSPFAEESKDLAAARRRPR